jgi:hypothetical protein
VHGGGREKAEQNTDGAKGLAHQKLRSLPAALQEPFRFCLSGATPPA